MRIIATALILSGILGHYTLGSSSDKFELSLADDLKVEMVKSEPEIRFKKWDVDLGVKYDLSATGDKKLLSDKVEWETEKQELHAYPIQDGFEIEIVLNEKPNTNVFDFQIEGHENLDFLYQPELTPEEIASGSIRPDNIIGSYAVYHKEKKDHILGETNYGTGKLMHIYRPKAIDADGKEQWSELSYVEGTLTVTVPQDFLDNASYPIRVDPAFGNLSVGATQAGSGDLVAGRFTSHPETGTITMISAYARGQGGVDSDLAAAIYSNSSDLPGTKLAEDTGNYLDMDSTPTWRDIPISYAFSASTVYWLAQWACAGAECADGDGLGQFYYYDTDSSHKYSTDTGDAWETWPATWASFASGARRVSIYATYTPTPLTPAPRNVIIGDKNLIIGDKNLIIQ